MRTLLTLILMVMAAVVNAQNAVEHVTAKAGFSLGDHFNRFSWIYISGFVVLTGVFVAGYMMGWDKKLFKSKSREDVPLFI